MDDVSCLVPLYTRTYKQRGTINRGLLFAGPLPPLLGSSKGQEKLNLISGGLNDDVLGGVGWVIPPLPWRLLATNSLFRALSRTEPFKDCCGPQHQQKPCFQDEKAPRRQCGPAATAKIRKEAILAE